MLEISVVYSYFLTPFEYNKFGLPKKEVDHTKNILIAVGH